MMAGAALHSDATAMPEEMILTDQEWIEVVQTIVSHLASIRGLYSTVLPQLCPPLHPTYLLIVRMRAAVLDLPCML